MEHAHAGSLRTPAGIRPVCAAADGPAGEEPPAAAEQDAWTDDGTVGEHLAGHLDHRGLHEGGVVLQGLRGILAGQAAQVGQDSRGLAQFTLVAEPFPVSSGARHGPPSSSYPRGAREP